MMKINQLFKVAYDLDPDRAEALEDALAGFLTMLLSKQILDSDKAAALDALAKYVRRRSDLSTSSNNLTVATHSLRQLRNDLTHSRIPRDTDFSPWYRLLWRSIDRLADKMEAIDVENLLAYSVGTSNQQLARSGMNKKRIVSSYQKEFRKLDEEKQSRAFAGILMRMFSDESIKDLEGPTRR